MRHVTNRRSVLPEYLHRDQSQSAPPFLRLQRTLCAKPGPARPCGIESIRNAKAHVAVQVKSYVMLDDDEPTTGVNWETMAETLEKAGVSWKLYQEVIYSTSD